jgi:hypothetical protein
MADCRVAGLHEYCFSQGENGLWAQRAFIRPGNSASFRGLYINKEIDGKIPSERTIQLKVV